MLKKFAFAGQMWSTGRMLPPSALDANPMKLNIIYIEQSMDKFLSNFSNSSFFRIDLDLNISQLKYFYFKLLFSS
jgi:hypothetical protein